MISFYTSVNCFHIHYRMLLTINLGIELISQQSHNYSIANVQISFHIYVQMHNNVILLIYISKYTFKLHNDNSTNVIDPYSNN
jgi:hypothetical protein